MWIKAAEDLRRRDRGGGFVAHFGSIRLIGGIEGGIEGEIETEETSFTLCSHLSLLLIQGQVGMGDGG